MNFKLISSLIFFLFLTSCGGSGSSSNSSDSTPSVSVTPEVNMPNFEELVSLDKAQFSVLQMRSLEADGEGVGLTAYELIRELGGVNPIESPDLYSVNHPETEHIFEDLDDDVGEHFVFVIHRDEDIDRDRTVNVDRQRNEIKTYGSSEDAVKGFENETMIFSWKFKINQDMEVSKNFSHFFQLKAVGAEDSHPILTITGNEQSSEDGMEIRHSPLQEDTDLARVSWSQVTGEWLNVYCRATFADNGTLRLIIERMSDGEILFDITETDIDMWRGEEVDHFVRPKWGIYRSLADIDNLRSDEENVRFANFEILKVQ